MSLFSLLLAGTLSAGSFVHFAPSEPDVGLLWWAPAPSGPSVGIAVDAAALERDVRALSGATPVTLHGRTVRLRERSSEEGLSLARQWLRAQYEALGFAVTEQGGWGGNNLIAERPGSEPGAFVVVSSHLDAVEGVPGADDDASGTVTALAIARGLAPYAFKHGLRIVAFDKEEDGLVGSEAYVSNLVDNDGLGTVLGVLHLEMTGYDPRNTGAMHSIDCNKWHSAGLTSLVMNAIKTESLPLHRTPACTNRSDHASFWRYQVPAIVVSENFFNGGANPCYHMTCDTADALNYTYMANIARAVGRAASVLLEPVQPAP